MKYFLQSRWKVCKKKLVYYGMRNKLFTNEIKLSKKQRDIILSLPRELSSLEEKVISRFLNKEVVLEKDIKKIPKSLDEARFCSNCIANDFIIPGLEFSSDGKCPMCQTEEETKELRSVLPILETIPRTKKSRFDIALFYTGGKDSTYLLYYLSKELGLNVLALTWEIPFMSTSAKKSINNAKEKMKNVEFVSCKMSDKDLQKVFKKLYALNGNTCACPSLAYVLFYPLLVNYRVPYFVAGNEPVQMQGLYYNGLAPKIAFKFAENKFLNGLFNIFRILTIKPPLKKGQIQTLMTMKQLAYGDGIKKYFGYRNELISNISLSLQEVNHLLKPLKRSIHFSSRTGNIPAFIHIDMDKINNGVYDWHKIKDVIIKECGWVGPEDKCLHTSCSIEKCKENTQFKRFYNMESRMIPFSALEISLASRNKNISRLDAIKELQSNLGFTLEEVKECQIMRDYLKK